MDFEDISHSRLRFRRPFSPRCGEAVSALKKRGLSIRPIGVFIARLVRSTKSLSDESVWWKRPKEDPLDDIAEALAEERFWVVCSVTIRSGSKDQAQLREECRLTVLYACGMAGCMRFLGVVAGCWSLPKKTSLRVTRLNKLLEALHSCTLLVTCKAQDSSGLSSVCPTMDGSLIWKHVDVLEVCGRGGKQQPGCHRASGSGTEDSARVPIPTTDFHLHPFPPSPRRSLVSLVASSYQGTYLHKRVRCATD